MNSISEIEDLESLSTIQKILVLQRHLKEMTSEKNRFIDNKNKMIEKLSLNCNKYFEKLVYIKEIFDYCEDNRPENNIQYEVIENSKIALDEEYQPLYDFFFLLRKENSLMLKIIELSDDYLFKDLSSFLVNFLYVNVIKSSFEDDELMIMIYLLLEKEILKIFPEKIETNKDMPITYFKKSFLFFIFKNLTRKIDLRNFLSTILYDFILKMESFSTSLSVNIYSINKFLNDKSRNKFHSFLKKINSLNKEEVHKIKKKFKKMKKEEIVKKQSHKNVFFGSLKRAGKIDESIFDGENKNNSNNKLDKIEETVDKIEESVDKENSQLEKEAKPSGEIKNKKYKKFEKRKAGDNDNNLDIELEKKKKLIETFNENLILSQNENEQKEVEKKTDLEKEKDEEIEDFDAFKGITQIKIKKKNKKKKIVEIDAFFELNSITIKKLESILAHYKNNNEENNNINLAMIEYLNILISNIEKSEIDIKKPEEGINLEESEEETYINDHEIYSNSIIIDELKSMGNIKEENSFDDLMRKIRYNHLVITNIIKEIINKLKDNLVSSPYCLKIISKMFDSLLNKFNDTSKTKLSNYQILMLKINFLIGNIILPIIKNPEYNGIASDIVISELTKENLNIISDIFDKIITGSLFNKTTDKYMTIFNNFIIETMPIFFELVQIIEKNFELPGKIKNLINNSNEVLEKRNINYDFFASNTNENINFQSICFTWKIVYLLGKIIQNHKKVFIEENKNAEQKLILEKFLAKQGYISNNFADNLYCRKNEYLYFTKISYSDKFNEIIKEDNIFGSTQSPNNDLMTAFKICMIEVLNYANKIQQENFYKLTENKEKTIIKKSIKPIEDENKNKIKFKGFLKSSLIRISAGNKKDDGDFRNIIFPQIKKNINLEINSDEDSKIARRINFCIKFINLYLSNIPKIYQKNNYSLLFDELINETKNNINKMKSKRHALFEYYKKIKEEEKLNMMISILTFKVKELEKLKCIQYLYNKILLPKEFKIEKDPENIISKIEYISKENISDESQKDIKKYLKSGNNTIKNMINEFPDFHLYEEEYDDILDIEENANTAEALNKYFSDMEKLAKKEEIMKRYKEEEKTQILIDLKNYILSKLYDKLFPFEVTKQDIFFYNKCKRLQFIKPENYIKDKKIVNEKLWEQVIKSIDNLDDKLTPIDKLKTFLKVIGIMQNSIGFSSGKNGLGVDDTLKPLVYVLLKAMPRNIISNCKYCQLYLDKEVRQGEIGQVLSQLTMFIDIIIEMKYDELIGVSEEQFGKDEIIE